jgi:CRISPR-associated protein Cmr2
MMTDYLYVLGIGPVQGFIASARRTRDLWMGSHLLSEISKAAAREIQKMNGKLIFPAFVDDNQIKHPERLAQSYDPDAFNVANIVRAVLTVSDPQQLTTLNVQIQDAAKKEWKECYADKALDVFKNIPDAINRDIWVLQVEDVIEFYAAWVPLDGKYDDAQKRLMRLLGSRKTLRNFGPSPATGDIQWCIEKSSLDGSRESVLNPQAAFPENLRLRMRLGTNEHLCAVGVTKRVGGSDRAQPFPSVVRVALDPWIRGITSSRDETAKNLLADIAKQCDGNNSFSSGTGVRNGKKFYPEFPFDGQILFTSRLKELMKDPLTKSDRDHLTEIDRMARQLHSCNNGHIPFGEPNPYYAILVADGDRMGKVISNIKSCKRHQEFSATLAAFAGEARTIVENDRHRGVMVYAGGEDILAFLPVDTCIAAARELHDKFGNLLKEKEFTDKDGKPATLSVGIAIGHSKDPLEDVLHYGQEAETDAKDPDRNGLAIHYHSRNGGDPLRVREEWTAKDIVSVHGGTVKGTSIDHRIDSWVSLFVKEKFPDGAAYDIRKLAEDYRGWDTVPEDLLVKDVRRLLKRKRVADEERVPDEVIQDLLAGVTSYALLVKRADELILARKIAESAMQANPKRTEQLEET